MKLFKRIKKETHEKVDLGRELTEAEIVADAFCEVYGALIDNINNDKKYKKVQENPAYVEAKKFIERKYKQLDHSVLVEVSTLMTLNEGLKVKFVPSKTDFIELEADFKPDSPDETGRRETFKIVKFAENGEKVFNKYYTKDEALIVKADREKYNVKRPSYFDILSEKDGVEKEI